nr:hypothetical protein [Kitasatospora azatica]
MPNLQDLRSTDAGIPWCPPVTSAALSEDDAEVLAARFKALSGPVRLRLLSRVASHPAGEACVCDIQGRVAGARTRQWMERPARV